MCIRDRPKDLWVRFVYGNLAGDDTSGKELTKLKPRQHLFQLWIIIGKQVILIALIAVSYTHLIVHHIVMGKHDALGKPGGAAGILHVADIMLEMCIRDRAMTAMPNRDDTMLMSFPTSVTGYTSP